MTLDPLPSTADALDALYRAQEDPFGARSIPEKLVRYREVARLLPRSPVPAAADLACGEGDFTAQLSGVARRVIGLDLAGAVVERARRRLPAISFEVADLRDRPPAWFAQFDLISWLDAIYWLTPAESARVLERIASGRNGQPFTLLVSSRIVPASMRVWYWRGHDFETPGQFLQHVRAVFPEARAVPLQLHMNLRPPAALNRLKRTLRIGFKIVIRLGGYGALLRLVQRLTALPLLAPVVEPFVSHVVAVVERGRAGSA